MEFRVLGPLEVRHRGRVVAVRGRRQRALLAKLVLNLGEAVQDERLLEDLWDGSPPASGGAALRVRVSQLRKALAAAEPGADLGAAIVTRGSGYALEADPGRIDAREFERLLGQGRRALRDGRPAEALADLSDGLGLWRGPALADLAYETFVQPDITRLEEMHLDALEERIDAELALGRDAELVGELEALVAAEPLRERLRGQLMLALYRSGRQADALAAYRDARRALTHELGIEPGARLRELERAVLRHDAVLDGPATEAGPAAPEPASERKLATVLVADADGEPDERRHEAMALAIEEAGGTVVSFPGEPLTATFGAPVAQEDHARRALSAARALQAGGEVRVGVETGEITVGGAPAEDDDATTAATRLCRAAEAGGLLVGPRAAAAARPARSDAGFVGRARELDLLLTTCRRAAAERRPQLATVLGDAGVGKTRLVRELWNLLGQEPEPPLRRTGRCSPYGRGTAYVPLGSVLREQLGLQEADLAETVRERLGDHEVLVLGLGTDAAGELSPLAAREALHSGWVEFLAEAARDRPLVLLVEDLHWAQDGLLDLLERILDQVDAPLAVVATARPELQERRPSWGRRASAATTWLEPLPPGDASAMLDSLAGDLTPELRATVLERAEGNPFFLEELLAGLLDPGTGEPGQPIPDSVQAVLAARIDRLPAREKAAVQAAAVIGRAFWAGPLREMLSSAAPDLPLLEARDFVRPSPASALAGERELVFKHALTRDVAYGTLGGEQRARLHGSFAAWLERAGGGRDEDAAALAHHYGQAATTEAARGKAVHWLRRAGELAVARYELEDAIALFTRARDLEREPEARLELARAIGRASALNYDADTFVAAMDDAIDGARDPATRADLCAEFAYEAFMRTGMWTHTPVTDIVQARITEALELAGPDTRARARALVANTFAELGDGAATSAEAYAIAERLDDATLKAVALDAQQRVAIDAQEYEASWEFNRRRLELLDDVHDPDLRADILHSPIPACIATCRFDTARDLARRADEATSRLSAHHRVHGVSALVEVAELLGDWPAIASIADRVRDAVAANVDTPCTRNARSLLVCALAAAELGDDAQAREIEHEAMEIGLPTRHVVDAPQLRLALVRGDLARAEELLERLTDGGGWYARGIDSSFATLVTKLDALAVLGNRSGVDELAPRVRRRGTYVEPFAQRALGIVHADEELVETAAARFDELGLAWHAAETRRLGRRVK